MTQEPCTFIEEARRRETWLPPAVEREGRDSREAEGLLATAALLRGVTAAIQVPEDAEERSRRLAAAYMQELRADRKRRATPAAAPWYLRVGNLMRFVFTLGRRR